MMFAFRFRYLCYWNLSQRFYYKKCKIFSLQVSSERPKPDEALAPLLVSLQSSFPPGIWSHILLIWSKEIYHRAS